MTIEALQRLIKTLPDDAPRPLSEEDERYYNLAKRVAGTCHKETMQAIEEARNGKGTFYDNMEDFFEGIGI